MGIEYKTADFAGQLAEMMSRNDSRVGSSLSRMVMHCAKEFDSKVALITALDETDQHFLAKFGIEVNATPKDYSFCQYAIVENSPLLVADASKDRRFAGNPLVVGDPYIRSYLGIPLADPDGGLIGTICLINDKPNHFSDEDIDTLSRYARGVEDLLRLHYLHEKEKNLSKTVTEQNELLREKNRIFREAERLATVGAWELNIETGRFFCTDGIFAMFEIASDASLTFEEFANFHEAPDGAAFSSRLNRAIESGERFEAETFYVTPDGKRKRFRTTGEVVDRGSVLPARLVCITADITDSYQSELALRHAAEHDSLTQLYNRYAFDRLLRDRLSQAKAQKQSVSLLLLDIDGFKDINDTLGHIVGDVVLEDIGQRIAKALPPGAVASRWGGDEFAIILPQVGNCNQAAKLGSSILCAVAQRTEISGHLVDINATAGLVHGKFDVGAKELVRRADTALFFGKRRETGKVHVYTSAIENENHVRRQAISEVRSAIAERRLFAGYQPVVDMISGQTIGYEALGSGPINGIHTGAAM